jgi:protein-ribulosamine 3-kinase
LIPPSLTRVVLCALAESGERSPITRIEPVKGGLVSKSWKITTRRRSYLLKYHENPHPYLYRSEERGLRLLRSAGARVPEVITASDKTSETPGYCIQEWIHPGSNAAYVRRGGATLGEEIARLHAAPVEAAGYGFDYSAEGGPKEDGWQAGWIDYLCSHHICRSMDRLHEMGLMPDERRDGLERVMSKMPDLLAGCDGRPSLVHGDLHKMNVLVNRAGEPVLIDPVVRYEEREFELAYAYLWGYFAPSFFDAYQTATPLNEGHRERLDAYTLCHLLWASIHRGHQFLPRVDAAIHRFVGYARR